MPEYEKLCSLYVCTETHGSLHGTANVADTRIILQSQAKHKIKQPKQYTIINLDVNVCTRTESLRLLDTQQNVS